MSKKGIDLSEFQENVDWAKVKAAGVEYAIIRAGFSETIDSLFHEHIMGALAAGIPVGVYWFSYAIDEAEARAEAKVCLETVKGYKLEYPIAYDFEYDSVKNAAKQGVTMTRELATAIVKAFCDEITAAGYPAITYTNPDFLAKYISMDSIGTELWLAAWQDADPPTGSRAADCRIWQYKVGICEGVQDRCDLDVEYTDAEIAAARAPQPEPEPTTPEAPTENTYIVKDGDTLWGIAEKLLGSGSRYPEVKALNGLTSDVILANQVLKIPDATLTTAPEATQAGNTYTVQNGDTLWGIAEKLLGNGSRYPEIKALNGLTDDVIHADRVLKLPETREKPVKPGCTVRITGDDAKYTNGVPVPTSIRARTHTVKQLSMDGQKALLLEIFSWVYTADLTVV